MNSGASDHAGRMTWDLLDRYLSGEVSPAEAERVDSWMREHPGVTEQLSDVATYLATSEKEERDGHVQSWNTLLSRITNSATAEREQAAPSMPARITMQVLPQEQVAVDSPLREQTPVAPQRFLRSWMSRSYILTIATLAVVITTIGGLTIARTRSATSTTSPAERTYVTAPGQQAIVTLDDGSQATLGPATTLTATVHPTAGTTVRITGQALFLVEHQSRHPFVVHTSNAVTRVLGTSFLVRRYTTDQQTRVVVTEGRVSLHSTQNSVSQETTSTVVSDTGVVLSSQMLGVVDDSGRVNVTQTDASDDYMAWTTGRLVFRQTPVHEIVAELSRAYGADIRVVDSTLRHREFTWTVSITQLSLADVINVLTTALQAHVIRSGNVLTIVPGASPSRQLPKSRFPLPIPSGTQEHVYGR